MDVEGDPLRIEWCLFGGRLCKRATGYTENTDSPRVSAKPMCRLTYLQSQIDATGKNWVDPFVLFACELNLPRRDAVYIEKLKQCMQW